MRNGNDMRLMDGTYRWDAGHRTAAGRGPASDFDTCLVTRLTRDEGFSEGKGAAAVSDIETAGKC